MDAVIGVLHISTIFEKGIPLLQYFPFPAPGGMVLQEGHCTGSPGHLPLIAEWSQVGMSGLWLYHLKGTDGHFDSSLSELCMILMSLSGVRGPVAAMASC